MTPDFTERLAIAAEHVYLTRGLPWMIRWMGRVERWLSKNQEAVK